MTLSRVCVAVSTALWSAKARFDGFVKSTLPYTLPAAQFLNELTSVATPVLALASTSSEPVIADNAMCTALTVGAFCGLNTFFTTQGYQIGVLQRRMLSMLPSSRDQLAAVEAGEARALVNGGESLATFPTVTAVPYRLPPAGIRALALTSGVITVGQWCANNIFLFGEMLKAWSRYRMNLEYAAYVTAAYVLFQLIFDWFSDAMEGVDGLINRAKYDHLVHSMHGCFKAIFGAQSMRTIPRVTGSISQALGRMIPILVFLKPDHLGWEVIIALTVLITIMVGVPVALQAYLFEGKTAIQNMERLANGPTDEERLQRWIESSDKHSDEQEMVSAPPSVPYLAGKFVYYSLYLGGPLDAIDAFLGPYAFSLAMGAYFKWPLEVQVILAWTLGAVVAAIVGFGNGCYIEVPEAWEEIAAQTLPRAPSRGIYNCCGLWSSPVPVRPVGLGSLNGTSGYHPIGSPGENRPRGDGGSRSSGTLGSLQLSDEGGYQATA